jgi:hypothetical protein
LYIPGYETGVDESAVADTGAAEYVDTGTGTDTSGVAVAGDNGNDPS